MIILAEIVAAIDGAGTLQTFYVSSGQYQTLPGDAPANTNFLNCMTDPGDLEITVYGGEGRGGGFGILQNGTLELANNDGQFDAWNDYGFDGRRVTLKLYTPGVAYVAMPVILTATMVGPPAITRKKVSFTLRDKQNVLTLPACTHLYGGTNVLPAGIDGTPNDIMGQRKPRTFGYCLNVSPTLVNTSKQIFQVNDGPVALISSVYVRGAAYTLDTTVGTSGDCANNAALQTATIAAGKFATCNAEGLFRLNDTLAGTITADVVQGAASTNRTVAQVIQALALSAGLTSGEISNTDVVALDAAQPATVGLYLNDETSFLDAINQVASGLGVYVVFDSSGVLRMGRLTTTLGTPSLSLTESQLLDFQRVEHPNVDTPVFQVQLNHTRNWTLQPSDIAGSVALSRQAFLKRDTRTWPALDSTVKTQFVLADTLAADSLLVDTAPASGSPADLEAQRLLALYKSKRNVFEAVIHVDVLRAAGLIPQLMSQIKVTSSRYGMASGRTFWLIGFKIELGRSRVTLTLWGPIDVATSSLGTIDLDYVGASYTGDTFAALSNVQSATLSVTDSGGTPSSFSPNTVRRNDLGVDVVGDTLDYIAQNSLHPASWTIDALGFSGSAIQSDTLSASTAYPNSRIFKTDNSGYIETPATEAVAVNDSIVVTFAVRAFTGQASAGANVKVYWNSGANEEGWYCADLTAGTPIWLNDSTFSSTGVKTQLLGSTPADAQGFCTVTFKYTAQATDMKLRMAPNTITTGTKISIGGVQAVRYAVAGKHWIDVATTTVVEAPDQLSIDPTSALYAILQASEGWIGLEIQGVGRANLGMAGITGSVAGDILLCGATHTLKPNSLTEFKVHASANSNPLGAAGGWRGITRIALSWKDSVGWTAVANDGPIQVGGAGTLTHSGLIGLLRTMTCKLRRIAAGPSRPADASLKAWTRIWDKSMVRPGASYSAAASATAPTGVDFFDDFAVSSLQTMSSVSGFPYGSFGAMLDLYWDATDLAHIKKWKPRPHYYTASADGGYGASEQINHELQGYNDPQNGAAIVTHEFGVAGADGRSSYFRGTTRLTSALTAGQKTHVGNNPSYTATGSLMGDQKYDYVSWIMTTAGSDTTSAGWTKGGYAVKHGVISCRAKAATGNQGAWWAFWLYNWANTAELDVQEQLGPASPWGGPTKEEFSTHWDNFAGGGTTDVETATDLSLDFHDYTTVWDATGVKMYLDGELMATRAIGGTFDNYPMFLLLNMAVQPSAATPWNAAAPAPDATSRASMPWTVLVDWVQVLTLA